MTAPRRQLWLESGTGRVRRSPNKPFGQGDEVREECRSQIMLGIIRQNEEFGFYSMPKARPRSILCVRKLLLLQHGEEVEENGQD